jgi:hypothetical protein
MARMRKDKARGLAPHNEGEAHLQPDISFYSIDNSSSREAGGQMFGRVGWPSWAPSRVERCPFVALPLLGALWIYSNHPSSSDSKPRATSGEERDWEDLTVALPRKTEIRSHSRTARRGWRPSSQSGRPRAWVEVVPRSHVNADQPAKEIAQLSPKHDQSLLTFCPFLPSCCATALLPKPRYF